MNTIELKALIVNMIGRQQLTSGQLYGQLCTDERAREARLGKPRLLQLLRHLVDDGTIEKIYADARGGVARYYVPHEAYIAELGCGPGLALDRWSVIKRDENKLGGTILGNNFVEADAKICAAALNERDRQVCGSDRQRKLSGSGGPERTEVDTH
jgi:hypothetical protein